MKNWKHDDELLNLAFGELSDRDSQALEAKLLGDSSAQKELDLLRTLRSDMVGLRDIPEMQFSKERLREAILSSGTKPVSRPSINWLNWFLGPAALASVAALAFVMTRGVNHKDPVFVANGKPAFDKVLPKVEIKTPAGLSEERVATNLESTKGEFPDVADTHWAREKNGVVQSSTTPPSFLRDKSPSKKRIRTKVRSAILVAQRDDVKPDLSDVNPGSRSGLKSADTATAIPSASASITVASTEAAPIILIDANTDSGVGAPTATEVSNPSNVAIGG